ncbi:MAG: hypothetical protein IIZ74_07120 [Erysipelotrichaceae bacterium]|nr:hypothetical protein [Erysipelotrichaceae bacterium]
MNPYVIIVIVLVLLSFGFSIFTSFKRNQYFNQLTEYLMKGKFEEFDKMLENPLVKRTIPPFNIEYMQLNRYLMEGRKGKAIEIYDQFKTRRLNDEQRKQVAVGGFDFFVAESDKERAAYYKDEINRLPASKENNSIKEEVNVLYDVVMDKNTDRLQELLDKNESMDEHLRGVNEYLISTIYTNLGNKEKAKEYENLSRKHMVMLNDHMSKKMQEGQK